MSDEQQSQPVPLLLISNKPRRIFMSLWTRCQCGKKLDSAKAIIGGKCEDCHMKSIPAEHLGGISGIAHTISETFKNLWRAKPDELDSIKEKLNSIIDLGDTYRATYKLHAVGITADMLRYIGFEPYTENGQEGLHLNHVLIVPDISRPEEITVCNARPMLTSLGDLIALANLLDLPVKIPEPQTSPELFKHRIDLFPQ